MKSAPLVLGVYLGHDPSCCLMQDGRVEFAIEEERLNRYKHGRPKSLRGMWPRFAGRYGYFPWSSVSYCLRAAALEMSELDLIVIGDEEGTSEEKLGIVDFLPVLDKSKVLYVDEPASAAHHFHHALYSFFLSRFDRAAVLVIDGNGDVNDDGYEAETGFLMDRSGAWQQVFKNRYRDPLPPRSGIGWMYEQISYLLGFGDAGTGLADPGKTMGLSAYGGPSERFSEDWIALDGFKLDFSGFKNWIRQEGASDFLLSPRTTVDRDHWRIPGVSDLAYKVQKECEKAIIHLAKTLRKETDCRHLCVGGGVALNSVANGLLLRESIFEKIEILPAVHDGGQSIGLAIHGHLLLTKPRFASGITGVQPLPPDPNRADVKTLHTPYLGRRYDDREIASVLDSFDLQYDLLADEELLENAAASLSKGKILGWFQGRSEIGPRALGNRSILACPTFENAKAILNSKVKFRESFRPFASAVLVEHYKEIFAISTESPYMLLVANTNAKWTSRLPGACHIDGTARLQTVCRSQNARFHGLIERLHRRTGAPVVLNTSFNLAGMPLVESPGDAVDCFLQTQMDELYLENFRVQPPPAHKVRYSIKQGWRIDLLDDCAQISAPDGTMTTTNIDELARRCLPSLNGESLQHLYDALRLSPVEQVALDSQLKSYVRLGCVQLEIGAAKVSNRKRDIRR
jgi:carbamoyltransferase